jgi:lytic murein transglycosylase
MANMTSNFAQRRARTRWLGAAAVVVLALAACETPTAASPPVVGPDVEVPSGGDGPGRATGTPPARVTFPAPPRDVQGRLVFVSSGDATLDAWRSDFAERAVAQGRDPGAVHVLLAGIEPHSAFLTPQTARSGISNQAEFAKPIWEYLRTAVSATRVTNGSRKMGELGEFFNAMETRHGVDRAVVMAIWGMETSYGGFIGTDDAAETLASMAVEGRRRAFAEGELIALVRILEDGQASRDELVSGWAGAMGQTQFMPTTYRAHAVDWDGDGRRDVWTSKEDALASAANYLAVSGYRFGEPWGIEVGVPNGFDYRQADGTSRTLADWRARGLSPVGGGAFAQADTVKAELWLPAGARGPKLLLMKNFDVFKTYNRADSYALAVGLLSDAVAGRPGLVTPWPTDIQPLSVAEIKALQEGLNALGFDAGTPDGIVGRRTRAALQGFQASKALPADGYPTGEMLALVIAAQG